jgi:drug/metabolite transporter (DMT)-like permease
MSLREKFAWVSLLTIVLGGSAYGLTAALGYQGILGHYQVLRISLGLLIAILILPWVIRALLAMRVPKGSMTAQDEREHLFELKATRIAFFVLAVCMVAFTPIVVHSGAHRLDIVHGILIATVLAYLVKFGAEILYHRRGY